ncbi:MAG: hypothetical protein MK212_08495 [Saprospiraceae bacterium]|nr:hypothetical protein [Saprospiraceae bacterium]
MEKEQILLCNKYSCQYTPSPEHLKIGVSLNIKDNIFPIHGLRHPPKGDTSGWYIWAGDYSEDPNFFQPLHIIHLKDWCPLILPYLGLSAGWRFLLAPDYEDVWQDDKLLLV